jgi:hypothetical protein
MSKQQPIEFEDVKIENFSVQTPAEGASADKKIKWVSLPIRIKLDEKLLYPFWLGPKLTFSKGILKLVDAKTGSESFSVKTYFDTTIEEQKNLVNILSGLTEEYNSQIKSFMDSKDTKIKTIMKGIKSVDDKLYYDKDDLEKEKPSIYFKLDVSDKFSKTEFLQITTRSAVEGEDPNLLYKTYKSLPWDVVKHINSDITGYPVFNEYRIYSNKNASYIQRTLKTLIIENIDVSPVANSGPLSILNKAEVFDLTEKLANLAPVSLNPCTGVAGANVAATPEELLRTVQDIPGQTSLED